MSKPPQGSKWEMVVASTSIGATEIVHILHHVFVLWTADDHLGNFQWGAIASHAPMNILVLVIWVTDIYISVEYIPRSGITVSKSVADTNIQITVYSCYLNTPETHASLYWGLYLWDHGCCLWPTEARNVRKLMPPAVDWMSVFPIIHMVKP